jgi:hypothetical protein
MEYGYPLRETLIVISSPNTMLTRYTAYGRIQKLRKCVAGLQSPVSERDAVTGVFRWITN